MTGYWSLMSVTVISNSVLPDLSSLSLACRVTECKDLTSRSNRVLFFTKTEPVRLSTSKYCNLKQSESLLSGVRLDRRPSRLKTSSVQVTHMLSGRSLYRMLPRSIVSGSSAWERKHKLSDVP